MKNLKKLAVLMVGILIAGSQLFSQNELVGTYYYQGNILAPLPDIQVDLYDMDGSLQASTVTDDYGFYHIEGIPDGEFYVVSSTDLFNDAITLGDAYQVLFYLFGWYDFTDMELEIADVNNSVDVTWLDFREILFYLIFDEPFTGGEWIFENVSVDFTSRTIGDTINPWGSSIGDVEGEWMPSGRDIDLMPSKYYTTDEVVITEINSFEIASDYEGYINGFNLNMAYSSDELNIVSISGPDEKFTYSVNEEIGIIKVAWLNESQGSSHISGSELFVIEVQGKNNELYASPEELISLLPGGILIDSENNKINDTEIKLPLLQNKQSDNIEVDIYPNPVINRINFSISSNKQSQVSLSIYDLNGKLVNYTEDIVLHDGKQAITIDVDNLLPANYIYSFEVKGENEHNVMGRFVKSK